MARIGNWSRLQQAREQVYLADALAQLARSEQATLAARENLTRLMGLWGVQTQFTLPDRLPDLPTTVTDNSHAEAQALRERLDVRTARTEADYVAKSVGFVKATGYVNALTLGYKRNTTWDNATSGQGTLRGWEVEVPLPIFDWGQARNARAQGVYLQAVERVRDVAVLARSEARESYGAYRTAYDLARHYRQEIVPLRQFINDELVLRYNGMLASVWDLLADTRALVLSTQSAIQAQRDFWLAETDLQTTLTGTSPGALAGLGNATMSSNTPSSAGH
jgi:outer membrane protein TolC